MLTEIEIIKMLKGVYGVIANINNSVSSYKRYLKKELQYLEFHITDHCNLKCKGCGHLSNIADEYFADASDFERDMVRLSKIFKNIDRIRLLGGEPLLHPDLNSFIKSARRSFPSAVLNIVTNGLLLEKADKSFWDTCRETNLTIDLTVYPPLRKKVSHLVELAKKNNVKLNDSAISWTFFSHMNIYQNSEKNRAFKECRKTFYCPFLKNGHIYICPKPVMVQIFNKKFNQSIGSDNGIDIYNNNGREILKYLDKPTDTCKSCEYTFTPFSWGKGNGTMDEWLPETYRKS
jgi:organic radical activating enzyme